MDRPLKFGSESLGSRLILGSARYPNHDVLLQALRAGGTEMVTVAIRRVNLDDPSGENLVSLLRRENFRLLPNTAGCYTVRDAVITAELARDVQRYLAGEPLSAVGHRALSRARRWMFRSRH